MRWSASVPMSKLGFRGPGQGAWLTAARDQGNGVADKQRRQRLAALEEQAVTLLEELPDGSFPEVESAAKAVRSALDVSVNLDAAQGRLKAAKPGTDEALKAQAALDDLRKNLDIVLPSIEATMQSVMTLVEAAVGLETQFNEAKATTADLEARLKREKERLAAAAKAVESAVKIG